MPEIYKITNLINQKMYIGYTINTAQHRFQQHWRDRNAKDGSLLHKALKKFGKNNFSVETVEYISENEWAEKEQYYIQFYNSLAPNGYNILPGGNKPPLRDREKNPKAKLTNKKILELYLDLENYDLDMGQIAVKYNISQSQVEKINSGAFWRQEERDYPIRKLKRDQYIISCIIEDLKFGKTQDYIEEKYQIKSRTRLYNINMGKVGRKLFPQNSYPIQPGIVNRIPSYLSKPVETIPVIGE